MVMDRARGMIVTVTGGSEQELSGRLTVLLADEDRDTLDHTAATLAALGHRVTPYAISLGEAAQRIAHEDPDLSVVVVHEDAEHALQLVDELARHARGPVVALLESSAADFLAGAAELGIAAFARTHDPEEVRACIEVARRRHAEAARLSEQVEQLEGALERRGLIERAKGILMERHGTDEREAFARLRDHARSRNRTVVEVARAVVEGHALLPGGSDQPHP
jgi:AmiR/NasT family two-component response regulator